MDFSEAIFLLSSVTEFGIHCNLRPAMKAMFGRDRFGLSPGNLNTKVDVNKKLEAAILKAIHKDKISVFAIKMVGVEWPPFPDGIMYFFDPYELIAFVVTEGFQLPLELQKAAKIYQINNLDTPLTIPSKKHTQRQAAALAFWHKYPKSNISKISRKFEQLKKYRGFHFINDSENRNRKVIKDLSRLIQNLH